MVNAIRSILPYLLLYVASAPECLSLRNKDTPRGKLSKYNVYDVSVCIVLRINLVFEFFRNWIF